MRPKVCLALPLWRIMYAESVANLLQTVMEWPFAAVSTVCNFRVDRAREEMTRQFLATDCEWLFNVDSDMEFPPGVVARLLRHNKPLVGGLYYSRHAPHHPFVWYDQPDGFAAAVGWEPGGLVPCDITGAGFLLVHRSVFESFGPPWWILDESDAGGTDIAFLRRAKAAGWQLFVDTGCVALHYGVDAIGPDDFNTWLAAHRDQIVDPTTGG